MHIGECISFLTVPPLRHDIILCYQRIERAEPGQQQGTGSRAMSDIFEIMDLDGTPSGHRKGAIIVGAGPSGLAAAAALKMRGIPSLTLEKEDCIGSLWKKRTYDRLHLHIPKKFCSLPHLAFPASFPEYPSRDQVVQYLDNYTEKFGLEPLFNHTVVRATCDEATGEWRVSAIDAKKPQCLLEYRAKWLIIASGENSETVLPQGLGLENFKGPLVHSSLYKNGSAYTGRRVLVVGSGNSGMEISLDLVNHGAQPFLAVRGQVHILPRDILGISTFSLTNSLIRLRCPIGWVDKIFLFYSWLLYGNLSNLGFVRPAMGPMEVKLKVGQTPVLDVGTLAMIKSGKIKVLPGVTRFTELGAIFANDEVLHFDAVIMATGYKSDVCTWLEGGEDLFSRSGHPKLPFPGGWKGENGLFAAGLTRRGLQGACHDAEKIADCISSHT